MPKSYLSPSDRARIARERDEIRARRRASSDISGSMSYCKPPEVDINDEQLAAQEQRLTEVLERESPPTISAPQKNAAYRELQALVKEYEGRAMTKYDQGLGYPEIMRKMGHAAETDFETAKKKAMSWEFASRGQFVGQRIKELASVIDPDNPELRNLENFRRRK